METRVPLNAVTTELGLLGTKYPRHLSDNPTPEMAAIQAQLPSPPQYYFPSHIYNSLSLLRRFHHLRLLVVLPYRKEDVTRGEIRPICLGAPYATMVSTNVLRAGRSEPMDDSWVAWVMATSQRVYGPHISSCTKARLLFLLNLLAYMIPHALRRCFQRPPDGLFHRAPGRPSLFLELKSQTWLIAKL